ncbi:MAG: GDSL-type esterase/lipase family protein [Clostridia bacterium]
MSKNKKITFSIISVILILTLLICVVLLSADFGSDALDTTYNAEKRIKMNVYASQNLKAEQGQIVFIGDSITELFEFEKYYTDLPLKIYNRGIIGDTADKMFERLETNCLNANPSKIFMLVGVNDLNRGFSAQTIVENITKSVVKAQTDVPEAKIFVQSIYPVNPNKNKKIVSNRTNNDIAKINALLKTMCNDRGVTFIDTYALLYDEQQQNLALELTLDGLHLNFNGYTKVSKFLLPYLI